ncbi:hypothetical protein [Streptomyces sp. NPDC057616]|uniref:hypothetical protein n=1 Tax=Streptomyces sp. NPDC057616 TaxID=3346183 RepID=UPI0036CFBAA6
MTTGHTLRVPVMEDTPVPAVETDPVASGTHPAHLRRPRSTAATPAPPGGDA